jgi:hypothetical protein
MFRVLQHLFHRPAIRLGVMDDARGLCRNPRFVSFMIESNRKPIDTSFHFTLLHGRRLLRRAITLTLAGGGVWILLESARALSVF